MSETRYEWETNPGSCFNHYIAREGTKCYKCTIFKYDMGGCIDYVTVQSMEPLTPDTYNDDDSLEEKVFKG